MFSSLKEVYEGLKYLDQRIRSFDKKIKELNTHSEVCQRLVKVPGIGPYMLQQAI